MQGEEDPIVVVVLGGAPKTGNRAEEQFRAHLLICDSLRPCREAMANSNKPCQLSSGALILAQPHQYDSTVEVLQSCSVDTRRWMVIIESKYEPILRMELAELPFTRRPRIRTKRWVLSVADSRVFKIADNP